MTKIPLLDLAQQYEQLRDELLPAMQRVLSTAPFILGEEVELFEDKFAATAFAIPFAGPAGRSSGTSGNTA